ncbi:SRPBCC family protein [Microbacterium resistens]|uniref:SRPBCC family protein n=1 Tax=Microbacterium resistens TaxID=156977 RepID=UPI003670A531
MYSTVRASTVVDVPVPVAYDQWTQFEDFPDFMTAVESIEQTTAERTRWRVEIGGVRREFTATVVDQVPDDHITWRSVDEEVHAGTVRFTVDPSGGTRVSLEMSWRPETFSERAGAALGIDDAMVRRDLENFKRFIETHHPTGAWRGEIHGGEQTD